MKKFWIGTQVLAVTTVLPLAVFIGWVFSKRHMSFLRTLGFAFYRISVRLLTDNNNATRSASR